MLNSRILKNWPPFQKVTVGYPMGGVADTFKCLLFWICTCICICTCILMQELDFFLLRGHNTSAKNLILRKKKKKSGTV